MLSELSRGFAILLAYFLAGVSLTFLLRKLTHPHPEWIRKLLHLVMLCSVFIFVYAFQTWWVSVAAAFLFLLFLLPVLLLARLWKGYSATLVERKKNEILLSATAAFGMFAVILSLCWGLFGQKWLAVACGYSWGLGDAAAALVGKRFGRHFLTGRLIEGRKTLEGSLAMMVVSFASILIVLLAASSMAWYLAVVTSLLAAAAVTAVELYTKNGMDTITCPLAAGAVILPLTWLWGLRVGA